MKITRLSPVSLKENTLDLPITQSQLDAYRRGALIQEAFPDLPMAEREFILSGITPEEWLQVFPPDEDEED